MSNNIEEAQLLKANRESLVNSLNGLGFPSVTEKTPLSEIADIMRWAGGLRDLRLATLNKSTGKYSDYSVEEWDVLSASAKASCVKLGLRIRAEGQDFIISKDNIYRENGATTMQWCGSGVDVKGLTNYGEGSLGHLNDKDGKANTDLILAHGEANNIKFEAAERARAYKASTLADGGYDDPTEWSLPAIGQLWLLYKYKKQINEALTVFFGTTQILTNGWYWSSTEYNSSNAWYVGMGNGNVYNYSKSNTNRVRAVALVPESSATPRVVYDIPFSTIIQAWIDCEQNKRSSNSCTKFRWHAARDLVTLWQSMCKGKYEPNASMVFMVTWPVLREVWAGAFRDRIVHHWEALRFGPVLENFFVEVGNVSMNCRKGFGSLLAVQTIEKMIYDYTEGYTRKDCYIVGGDFANFFMSIDKDILWEALEQLVMDNYEGEDKPALMYMMRTTLFHKPQEKFYRRSPEELWNDLPPRKSLFHMNGLAIGNLPSQLWANLMGAIFTWWIMHNKGYKDFIIFVDDWRVLVRSEAEGRQLIKDVSKYLWEQLHITLHPNKIYLQHYSKGTKVVGAVIKPGRVYIANRTRGHFIDAMRKYKERAEATTHAGRVAMLEELRASINSYLGLMCHYNSYKVRRRICEEWILPTWGKYLYFTDEFTKCKLRVQYDKIWVVRKRLKKHKYAAKFIRPKWRPDDDGTK